MSSSTLHRGGRPTNGLQARLQARGKLWRAVSDHATECSSVAGSRTYHNGAYIRDDVTEPSTRQGGADVRRSSTDSFTDYHQIYEGAVSTVYHATCRNTGRRVVLKAYHKHRMDERHHVRLSREIFVQSTIQRCAAPHVCELMDSFEDDQDIYLVLERCDGGDVFQLQHDNGGCLNESFVCTEIIIPLLRVLEQLHNADWIHRDIKPENIFLTADTCFKLGDFGLSINYREEHPFHISGTLDYLAPEMLRNPSNQLEEGEVPPERLAELAIQPYGPSVDVWSVGVIAYELITGQAPFSLCPDEQLTMRRILNNHDIDLPSSLSPQWADFVRCALDKEPLTRPDASLLLDHPWVRKHEALRHRGVPPDPCPEHALLGRTELRAKPRGKSVDSAGIRSGASSRVSMPLRAVENSQGMAMPVDEPMLDLGRDAAASLAQNYTIAQAIYGAHGGSQPVGGTFW